MKFAHVTFSEEKTINAIGEQFEVKPGTAYQFPLNFAKKLEAGEPAFAALEGTYEVDDEDVQKVFGTEADGDVEMTAKSEEEIWLDDNTVDDARDAIKQMEDIEWIKSLAGHADRKGVISALQDRMNELEGESEEE